MRGNVRQKPAEMLAFKRGGRAEVPAIPPPPTDIPPCPADVGDYAQAVWAGFWTQPTSGLVNLRRDGERLRHWIRCVDQRWRLWQLYVAQPIIKDTNGLLRTNPLFRQVNGLSADIERAEAHFGMTPLAKMRLTGVVDQEQQAEERIEKRERRKPKLTIRSAG